MEQIANSDNVPLAVAYRLNGVNFRMSAETLAQSLDVASDGRPVNVVTAVPLYLLISYAIELLLKSALLKRGIDASKLKGIDLRHNLNALLSELQRHGVLVTADTVGVVGDLSEAHANHELRYKVLTTEGAKIYCPPLPSAFAALDELLLLTRISTQDR